MPSSTGLRTSVGELLALRSRGFEAPSLMARFGPSTAASRGVSYEDETMIAPTPAAISATATTSSGSI